MTLAQGLIDLSPLRLSPAFRRLWVGRSLSGLGRQLAIVAVLYQVWELTHDPIWVGAIGLVRGLPTVVLSVIGGSLADIVDRRRLVLATTAGQVVAMALLAGQALAQLSAVWLVLELVAFHASCDALGAPAYRTFVSRLLPTDRIPAGVALTHLSFQATMLAGPAIAGVIVGRWGVTVCYAVDAAMYCVMLYCVAQLPAMRPTDDTAATSLRAIWDGWRFIRRQPVLRGTLLTDLVATVSAMPMALYPAVNATTFGGRPETLGLIMSAVAVGGIAAGLGSGSITRAGRPGMIMLVAACVWGAGLAGFGLSQTLWLALGSLAVAGAADTISVISRGAIVQLATPDSRRGRASAAEHVVGVAGPDIGNFRAGLVAGATSPAFALAAGGLVCIAGVAGIALAHRPMREFRTR